MKRFLPTLLLLLSAPALAQNTGIGTINPTDQLHTTGTVRFQNYSGRGTRLMQVDTAGRIVAPGSAYDAAISIPVSIPDFGCPNNLSASAQIQVTGELTTVASSKIAVKLNITHPYDGDLVVVLQSPGGALLNLAYANGSGGDNFTNTIFTDEAPTLLSAGAAPFTGTFKPRGSVVQQCTITPTVTTFSAIGGGTINPNGVWTLLVYDNAINDAGTLNGWSISFNGPESFATSEQSGYVPRFLGGGLKASALYQDFYNNIGVGAAEDAFDARLNAVSSSARLLQLENSTALSTTSKVDLSFKNGLYYTGIIRARGTANNAGALGFYTGAGVGNSNALTERLTILNNGNVGIGDTDPSYKLDVNGTIHSSGTVSAPALSVTSGSPAAGKVLTATDGTGAATWQNPASRTTGFQASTAGVNTSATYNATIVLPLITNIVNNTSYGQYDEGGNFSSSQHRFVAPVTGFYHFDATVSVLSFFTNQAGSVDVRLQKYTSTNTASGSQLAYTVLGSGIYTGGNFNVSWNFKMSAGDYVQLEFTQDCKSNASLSIEGEVTGYRVY